MTDQPEWISLTPEQRDMEIRLDEVLTEMLRSGVSKEDLAEMVSDYLREWDE